MVSFKQLGFEQSLVFLAKICQKGTQFSENEIFFDKFPVFWKNNRLQETNFFFWGEGVVTFMYTTYSFKSSSK
jgi:hypothetical protein